LTQSLIHSQQLDFIVIGVVAGKVTDAIDFATLPDHPQL
jgi:hypothetical protein